MSTVFLDFLNYCRHRGKEFNLVTSPRTGQRKNFVSNPRSNSKMFVFSKDCKPALMSTQSYNQRICGTGWRFLGGKTGGSGSWLPTFISSYVRNELSSESIRPNRFTPRSAQEKNYALQLGKSRDIAANYTMITSLMHLWNLPFINYPLFCRMSGGHKWSVPKVSKSRRPHRPGAWIFYSGI
jgi:hypothetical protein